MRRITIALMSTLSGLVLIFSYHTSLNQGTTAARGSTGGSGTGAGTGGVSGATSGGTASASGGSRSGSSGTFTGEVAQTRWGPVQVQITVKNGKITAASATQIPDGNSRDAEINSYAVPILNDAVVQAQSARIDAVSGATVTSDGYVTSLQSAIDQAHLG
jgi:uncharacterized protein with FMN-binding domain